MGRMNEDLVAQIRTWQPFWPDRVPPLAAAAEEHADILNATPPLASRLGIKQSTPAAGWEERTCPRTPAPNRLATLRGAVLGVVDEMWLNQWRG